MGYIQAILAFLIWGAVSPLLVRFIPLPAPVITFSGSAAGAVMMLAVIGSAGRREVAAAYRQHTGRLLAYGVSFIGCSLCFHVAIKSTTLANAEITHACQALITCLLLMPLLRMGKLAVRDLMALAAGLAGLWIAMPPDLLARGHGLGIGFGLLSAVFYALLNVQVPYFNGKVRTQILQTCNLVTVTAMIPFAAGAYRLFVGPLPSMDDFSMMSFLALMSLGLMNFIVANLLFIRSLGKVPVSHVSILGYTEPVIGIAAGALFLGEGFSANVVIGGALVLISSALVMRWHDAG